MVVFLNGQFLPEAEAVVPVNDRGFLYGDGLFETMRVANGKPFRLAQHLERLTRGADFLKIKPPFKPKELEKFAAQLIAKNQLADAILRVTLTRGPGVARLSPKGADQADAGDDVASPRRRWKRRLNGAWSRRLCAFRRAMRWLHSRRPARFCTSWRGPRRRRRARTRRCSSTPTARWRRRPAEICSGFIRITSAPCRRGGACCPASRGRSCWKSASRLALQPTSASSSRNIAEFRGNFRHAKRPGHRAGGDV